MKNINIVVSHSKNYVIGYDNIVPWFYEDEYKYFNDLTTKTIEHSGHIYKRFRAVIPKHARGESGARHRRRTCDLRPVGPGSKRTGHRPSTG